MKVVPILDGLTPDHMWVPVNAKSGSHHDFMINYDNTSGLKIILRTSPQKARHLMYL